ncbi:MAG: hypothetical protein LGB54_03925 [Sulfurovum sp.]|nr:hypothetical protein [Sulfurovum sp.]
MLKILQIGTITITLLLLDGCAATSYENFAKTYNSWVGQKIHTFTDQVGYPDNTYKLANGNKVYVYKKTRIYASPTLTPVFGYNSWGHHNNIGIGYGTGISYKTTCKLFLEVNKKGIIVRWRSKGNNCRM